MENAREEKLREIWFVTSGEGGNPPNPNLTEEEKQQLAEKVKLRLPSQPSVIMIGTGRRHLQTAEALNLIQFSTNPKTHQIQVTGLLPTLYTYEALVGGPEILTDTQEGKKIVLADGTDISGSRIDIKEYLRHALLTLIGHLPPHSLIISDAVKLSSLTKVKVGDEYCHRYDFLGEPKSCSLYLIQVNDAGSIITITGTSEADSP